MSDDKSTDRERELAVELANPKWEAILKAGRKRGFMGVVYGDSAKTGWQRELEELHMQVVISPLHDADVNADGSPKKPHHHVMLLFDAPTTPKNALKIFLSIGAVVAPTIENFAINSTRSMARYFCHLDNPDKHQYDPADVIVYGGFDYKSCIAAENDDKRVAQAIMDFILENDEFTNIYEFTNFCRNSHAEWYEYVCSHSVTTFQNMMFWREKTRRNKIRAEFWRSCGIDPETAEALGYRPGDITYELREREAEKKAEEED